MDEALTTATWFWLLVPMLSCVGLALITYLFKI